MALITCKDCKKEFSTDAKRCPHCGAKKPVKQWSLGKIFLGVFGFIIIGAMLDTHDKAQQPAKTQVEINQEKARDMALDVAYYCREWVKKSLHDPESAEFDDPTSYYVTNKKGDYTVDVTLRAKNGFNALRKTMMVCRLLVGDDRKILPIGLKELK